MSSSIIKFENIHFAYKNQKIHTDFNFSIPSNQLIGVIGVNGSGKSTLLKLIAGILKPQSGTLLVCEEKAGHFKTKSLVGTSLQEIDFPSSEKVTEILKFVADQYDQHLPIQKVIEDCQLTDFQSKSCGQLSGGMKRRLSLACAMIGRPRVVLLDEPTTGLDLGSRKKLMENLLNYKKEHQALILMISHHPEEVMNEVDQFYHIKNNSIETVTTEEMNKLTRLKKIIFKCPANVSLPKSLKEKNSGKWTEAIAEDGDQYIKELCQSNVSFSNLTSRKLTAEEILGEIL